MANHVLTLAEAVRIYDGLPPDQLEKLHDFVMRETPFDVEGADLRRESIAVIRWQDWEQILSV